MAKLPADDGEMDMVMTRRMVVAQASAVPVTPAAVLKPARAAAFDLAQIPTSFHEWAMRAAIEVGRSAYYPFGAVIVRPPSEGLLAQGANDVRANPTYHGEIVCMNDYVMRHGNRDWNGCVLYTTAEPCPMCMGALVWARISGVVYGTSIATLSQKVGMPQITIPASRIVNAASAVHHVELLGGILAAETDAMFIERRTR